MINFKISDLFEGLITVTKPLGKPISLNVGEIVKGEVTDLLSTGGVTLKIKDSFITAKTDIPLQKNTEVMLKVLGTSSPNELKLQFMGLADKESEAPAAFRSGALNKFIQDFSGAGRAAPLTMEKIEGLLKALPSDVNYIPKDLRLQLQGILQEGLKSAGQDIQSRLDELLKALEGALKDNAGVQNLKSGVTVDIDRLLADSTADNLKELLRDTGVALESKLRTVAELLQPEADSSTEGTAGRAGTAAADRALIENDLKANLLRLKEILANTAGGDTAAIKNAAAAADGILKDIETFQLLSRTTQSFYTFLPVSWSELRDGEIALKQNRGEGKAASFSCRLNLDLEDHGKLVVMVLSHNNEFFVSFRPESEAFKSLLSANVENLEVQFSEKGLSLKAVRVLDKEDTSLESLENLEPYRQIVSIKA